MIGIAKSRILRLTAQLGYQVLKREEYQSLLAAARLQTPVPPTPSIASMPATLGESFPHALNGLAERDAADVISFIRETGDRSGLPIPSTQALYFAARYLTRANVTGDVLDCGYGSTGVLTVLASAFIRLGDTTRRLVLFDDTADPLHRAEKELTIWGRDQDLLLSGSPASPRPSYAEPPPLELEATGYPIDRISVQRYPREEIKAFGKLAFVGLTSQTFPANRDAIAEFLPQLSPGGVIAVSADPFRISRTDAVEEFLCTAGTSVLFFPIAEGYRMGIKP